ncbi:hypothetical protein BJY52DRAFT_1236396 [Lactarius psammicola]|nr:hypothetical protein BJY52DRAFT_1236396 [Lactarius psammicola]
MQPSPHFRVASSFLVVSLSPGDAQFSDMLKVRLFSTPRLVGSLGGLSKWLFGLPLVKGVCSCNTGTQSKSFHAERASGP